MRQCPRYTDGHKLAATKGHLLACRDKLFGVLPHRLCSTRQAGKWPLVVLWLTAAHRSIAPNCARVSRTLDRPRRKHSPDSDSVTAILRPGG